MFVCRTEFISYYISLGMKKAEYAAGHFLQESSRASFLNAMEQVAKLASAGRVGNDGKMDYGISKGNYLGHGSNLVRTTDTVDMMRTMDPEAYEEYKSIDSSKDGGVASLKYMLNWHNNAVKKRPSMVSAYEKQSEEYIEKNVKGRTLDTTFDGIKTESKEAFLESLRAFQKNRPDFLSSLISREIAGKFWS